MDARTSPKTGIHVVDNVNDPGWERLVFSGKARAVVVVVDDTVVVVVVAVAVVVLVSLMVVAVVVVVSVVVVVVVFRAVDLMPHSQVSVAVVSLFVITSVRCSHLLADNTS